MWLFRKQKSINEFAEEGNALFEKGNYNKAIAVWTEALKAIDAPLNTKSEAVWFQTSIGDALFMMGKYGEAYEYLFNAKSNLSGDGYENPFTMLRLGQCAYELGKEDAKEYLLRAYLLAGNDIFEDGKKYFEVIKDLI